MSDPTTPPSPLPGSTKIAFDEGGAIHVPFDEGGALAPPGGGGFGQGPLAGGTAPAGSASLLSIGILQDPAEAHGRFPLVMGTRFPRRAWDPALYAVAVLAEFAATGWMSELSLPPPPTDPLEVGQEIATLIKLSEQRVSRSAEIAAQAADASVYWSAMLMMTQASRPATWDLIINANTVGHLVAMHFKRHFARPRPAQVYPALMPILPTPSHPSYPNAHALESALIAACLELAIPSLGSPKETQGPLDVLAERIGVNREIAGLHFPSDTRAGRSLIPGIMDLLTPCPLFHGIVAEAKKEWEGIHVVPFGIA